MRLNSIFVALAVLVATTLVGCKNDDPRDHSFDNQLYMDTEVKVATTMVKPSTLTTSRTIRSRVAEPVAAQVDIVYAVAASKVDTYNQAYYDNALMLPEQNYEIALSEASIPVGSVRSTEITVQFKELNALDRKQIYVLPVTIESATNIALLESGRTVYYVFKAGAVINVVANIRENSLEVKWENPSVVNSLRTMTMEAMIRVHSYDHIMTVMGIEGVFLMRISDEGYPSEALQIATSDAQNFPSSSQSPLLPKDKWVQIALTMNAATGEYVIYIDGNRAVAGTGPRLGTINLTQKGEHGGFYIGKSYNDSRWLDGEISECRIWNVIRTQEQIAAGRYEVEPTAAGLVAYWKFDEGASTVVNDRTGNGNNAKAESPLKWIPVTLPE
ncbi:MAG: DUF1735 and LamG domain-containing protein [Alistipes sp.]